MTDARSILKIDHVSKSYSENGNTFQVLEDINFEVHERDFVCIVGPSGCGKSTLLREIVGLDRPTSGGILFEGAPVRAEDTRISMVFQSFALFPWLTVSQNVQLGLEAHKVPEADRRAKAKKYIEAVGLAGFENAYPRELSAA